jgi:hypothetical protein
MKEVDIKDLLQSIQLEREEYLETERQHHRNQYNELMRLKYGDYYPITEHWGLNNFRYSFKTIVMVGLNGTLYGRYNGEGELVNIPNESFLEHDKFDYSLDSNTISFHNADGLFYSDINLKTESIRKIGL